MNLSVLFAVVRKELTDNLRDRRAVFSAMVFPLIGPIMFSAMFTVVAGWMRDDKAVDVAVAGRERAPHLVEFLERAGAHVTVAPPDFEAAVKRGELDVVVDVPPGFAADFKAGHPAAVRLVFDQSRNEAENSIHRTRRLIDMYSKEIGVLRLFARGVSPELATAIEVDEIDVATSQQRAATILNMIPLFILLSAFMGGMHVAIDTTAGERERGSLEPLLINPVSRWSLLLGKWASAVAVSWIAVAVCITGFAQALRHVPLHDLGIKVEMGLPEIAGIAMAVLPVSLFSVSVMMLVGTFARSFKEAQSYCTVVQFLPMVPGVIMSISPLKPVLWMTFVPVLSQSILISQVMRGEATAPSWFAIAVSFALLGGIICLGACVRLFRHEKIVFGR